MSARVLRKQAVARLAEIAGYDERFSIEATLARPRSIDVLHRQALRKATGDVSLLDEVNGLYDVAKGYAAALDDAIHEDGLPEPTAVQITPDEFEQAVTKAWGVPVDAR